MMCFTRADFSTFLHFSDLRASELTLAVGGVTVAARSLVSRFVSNTDVVMDRIDVTKVAQAIGVHGEYTLEVEKSFPFHEVLIRPCLTLSARHQYAYSPVLWIGRNSRLDLSCREIPDNPIYGVLYEGSAIDLPRLQLVALSGRTSVSLAGPAVGALFVPNAEVQAEVEKRLRAQGARPKILGSGTGGSSSVDASTSPSSHAGNEAFIQTLRSLWPSQAMGRLPTYIYLKEGRKDISAYGVESNVGGDVVPGRSGELYEEVELAPGIILSKAPEAAIPRSPAVDALALRGVLAYRAGEWSEAAGWPVYVSSEDPAVVVRSNGVVRWMRLSHGLVESIERLSDGRNLALGARTAMELHGHLIQERSVLYGGLGLGVIQRSYALDSPSVTCEVNAGVIAAFEYIYPECIDRLKILHEDIFAYARRAERSRQYSMAFLDFFDPADRAFHQDHLADLLSIADVVVVNRHIKGEEDLRQCNTYIDRLPYPKD
jgi:hypothetical protein